ncbi:MAG TPA: hypothetical protein VFB45_25735 [Pseudolabrys sp.]|nr:hypothetical protein [Pseudolabrys sp.]
MKIIAFVFALLGLCLTIETAAAQTGDCKLCREDYLACRKAHSEAACKANYDICRKHCRAK